MTHLKKVLSFLALLLCLNSASAQTYNPTLGVTLTNVVAFTLTDLAPALVFSSSESYSDGVTYTNALAGTVTATGNFSVSVASATENLSFTINEIPISSIKVQASGTDMGTTPLVTLSTTEQDIISNAPSGLVKPFSLTYSTTGNDANFLGKPAGIYTASLIYTATLD